MKYLDSCGTEKQERVGSALTSDLKTLYQKDVEVDILVDYLYENYGTTNLGSA